MIHTYLESLGLKEKEITLFLHLYQYGAQPASTIARVTHIERTLTYKILLKLVDMGLVIKQRRGGSWVFALPSLGVIEDFLRRKKREFDTLESQFGRFSEAIKRDYQTSAINTPKITVYEHTDGIRNMYDDILRVIDEDTILGIKFFASNTFSQEIGHHTLGDFARDFSAALEAKHIEITSFIGMGSLIMESIETEFAFSGLLSLPADKDATQIWIV